MTILFAILLFSFLIFIHEFGHFIAAKLSGVQVNEFALFMGPAIFKKQVGETLYSIRCLPIGGYCAMEGENLDTENPRSFLKAAWWKRLIILVAGSFMNFVTGVVLLIIVFTPFESFVLPEIAAAEPGCTVVSQDGLHVGDRFVEVDGERIYAYTDFDLMLSLNPGEIHDLVVKRDGKLVELKDFRMEKHSFSDGEGGTQMRYGFEFAVVEANFSETVKYIWNSGLNMVRNVRLSLQMLFTGAAGFSDLSGPVGIVKIMSDTAQASQNTLDAALNLLYFGAFIAINLSIMNMLPIPALDGGRALGLLITTAIEKISGKKVNARVEATIHGVGLVLLLGLMAVILFKDVITIFKG